jgi:hypothetical protein
VRVLRAGTFHESQRRRLNDTRVLRHSVPLIPCDDLLVPCLIPDEQVSAFMTRRRAVHDFRDTRPRLSSSRVSCRTTMKSVDGQNLGLLLDRKGWSCSDGLIAGCGICVSQMPARLHEYCFWVQ